MTKWRIFKKITLLLLFLAILSCNNMIWIKNRIKYADNLVKNTQFIPKNIETSHFYLFSYQKFNNLQNKVLNIYIEGDGLAWRSRNRLSKNPTPTNPVALKMALADNADNIIYIARPCQYIDFKNDKNCQNRQYWSQARFSKEVVKSINDAIDKIKKNHDFKKVNLYGFSGGGGLAVLVASLRDDVVSIKTIAANLNHKKIGEIHQATPLSLSLDPVDFISDIAHIKQLHIAGGSDKIVLDYVIRDFVDQVNNYSKSNKAQFKLIKEADHEYKKWPEI